MYLEMLLNYNHYCVNNDAWTKAYYKDEYYITADYNKTSIEVSQFI